MAVKAEANGEGGISPTETERLIGYADLLREGGATYLGAEYTEGVWKIRVKMGNGEQQVFTFEDDDSAAAFLGGIQR